MSGNVVHVPFPEPEPNNCMNCRHVLAGQTGMFCHLYREDLLNGSEALECEEFDDS